MPPSQVIIDGIEYIPRAVVPPLTNERLTQALMSLTEIQYFSECSHKHRAWAWMALKALAPDLAELAAQDPQAAFHQVRAQAWSAQCAQSAQQP